MPESLLEMSLMSYPQRLISCKYVVFSCNFFYKKIFANFPYAPIFTCVYFGCSTINCQQVIRNLKYSDLTIKTKISVHFNPIHIILGFK